VLNTVPVRYSDARTQQCVGPLGLAFARRRVDRFGSERLDSGIERWPSHRSTSRRADPLFDPLVDPYFASVRARPSSSGFVQKG
jgi:hypothetical protein